MCLPSLGLAVVVVVNRVAVLHRPVFLGSIVLLLVFRLVRFIFVTSLVVHFLLERKSPLINTDNSAKLFKASQIFVQEA